MGKISRLACFPQQGYRKREYFYGSTFCKLTPMAQLFGTALFFLTLLKVYLSYHGYYIKIQNKKRWSGLCDASYLPSREINESFNRSFWSLILITEGELRGIKAGAVCGLAMWFILAVVRCETTDPLKNHSTLPLLCSGFSRNKSADVNAMWVCMGKKLPFHDHILRLSNSII